MAMQVGTILETVVDYMTAPVGTVVEAVTGHDDDDNESTTRWLKSSTRAGWVHEYGESGDPQEVRLNGKMAYDGPTVVVA